jgi:hypothetical protein
MGMKTTLLLAASLLSTAAFAQTYRPPAPPSGTAYGVGYNYNNNNRYDDDDYDDAEYQRRGWRRGDRRGGHYELKHTQQWVPGVTTQVWVNGFCHRPPFSPVQVCTQGRYENRTSPGYYRTVQQWVWVEHHRRGNRWGRR